MTSRWAKWRSLTWSQRALLIEAPVELVVTVLALKLRGLQPLRSDAFRALGASQVSGPEPAVHARRSSEHALEIAGIVEMALRHLIVRANCLQRSVTLWRVLRRHGIDSEVRIGVRRAPGEAAPSFHAWVERGGVVLNERPEVVATFVTFGRSPKDIARSANFD